MMKQTKCQCNTCEGFAQSIFRFLTSRDMEVIEQNKICHLHKKGQVIFHEGNPPLGLYCIQSGNVKVFKSGIDGREQIVRMAKKGDILGYRTLVSEEVYRASAATLVDSCICFIDRQVFIDVAKTNHKFLWAILGLMGKQLHEAENLIAGMAQKNVRERLAEVLLLLHNKYGCASPEDQSLNVVLTRDELASIVGTATETLIRHLSDFKEEKVIEVKGRKIKIIDQSKLIKIANV